MNNRFNKHANDVIDVNVKGSNKNRYSIRNELYVHIESCHAYHSLMLLWKVRVQMIYKPTIFEPGILKKINK